MGSSSFVDHSGLGPGSRVTAADLCAAYRRLGTAGTLRRALKEIPLRDADGRTLPVLVQAKTGTLNFVSALAGYVQPFDGDPMIFAILTADLGQRALVPPGEEDAPPGAAWWANRSRGMQRELLKLWSGVA
jgi:D-alanyl-D-alanine carboxypeptidase/D-alanyl-D-alanine-endopeptidase (penicillin-binding protein 4)